MSPDTIARIQALTDIESTLLVEAAAGTGKTALIAGRVVVLLAKGVEPKSIAAITFTELAASELAARVREYVACLLGGQIPAALCLAFPDGLSEHEAATLAHAAQRLDELTAATIHSFCQRLILSHIVEAGVDPGAQIIDAEQADAAFQSIVSRWITRRLTSGTDSADPIVVLSRQSPREVVEIVRSLARFRLRYRKAGTLPADLSGRPDIDMLTAVRDFGKWLGEVPPESMSHQLFEHLESLAKFYEGSFAIPWNFERLWHFAHPPISRAMRWGGSKELQQPPDKFRGAWKRVGKEQGQQLYEEFLRHFERIDTSYRTILGKISTGVVAAMASHLQEILDDYAAFKRSAAVLDFDDLIEKALALVEGHESARVTIGGRYRHILVDEFQDTDPAQCRIVFGIAAQEQGDWKAVPIRPGALFLVGDPKQAIYGFRGASIETYSLAREAITRSSSARVINLTSNFRSRPPILDYVNHCFAGPLSDARQPGYVPLTPTLSAAEHTLPCVSKLAVKLPDDDVKAALVRREEAIAVADLCKRLLARFQYRNDKGELVPLGPGDIALLVPQFSGLDIYEEAFDEAGLPIASQAGKGLYRRQEVQDLIALVRALADPSDTVAFGALLRGPLVGLSDQALLDVLERLPSTGSAPKRFSILTNAGDVKNGVAKAVLETLQDLRRLSRSTTPALLLAEAVERLMIVPILKQRDAERWTQSAANVEAIIQRARGYDIRGLKGLARDLEDEWAAQAPARQGRIDSDDAVSVVTMHTAKGLEWPVVIPINRISQFATREQHVYRSSDNTVHWVLGDVASPDLKGALAQQDQRVLLERQRLMYVACTRARELLIIPDLQIKKGGTWTSIVDLSLESVPEIHMPAASWSRSEVSSEVNGQTKALFDAEAEVIRQASAGVTWRRATDHDTDRQIIVEIASTEGEVSEVAETLGAGNARGLVLHKLLEEVLTGELVQELVPLRQRAETLVSQLVVDELPTSRPDSEEMAQTVIRTLAIPEIVELRDSLAAEVPIYSVFNESVSRIALAGRIDAVAHGKEGTPIPIDWKSDVAPSEADVRRHASQLAEYLVALQAPKGLLVYMTTGALHWVSTTGAGGAS